jgi:SNF2 family DNA or RNA helicase
MVLDRFVLTILFNFPGTPVHNSLKDIYSLLRFLEYPVFSAWNLFRQHFVNDGARTGALRLQIILRGLMMRRKKDDQVNGRPLIVLPEKVHA